MFSKKSYSKKYVCSMADLFSKGCLWKLTVCLHMWVQIYAYFSLIPNEISFPPPWRYTV